MTVVQPKLSNESTIIRSLPDIREANYTIYSNTWDLQDDIHSDLAGKFPYISYRGNQYILVSVFHGYIHVEIMPNREAFILFKST
jgi:hypothetical protein